MPARLQLLMYFREDGKMYIENRIVSKNDIYLFHHPNVLLLFLVIFLISYRDEI
jgi:hypothetical protein